MQESEAGAVSRGFFIVFEGIDGSGKTTQIKRLAKRMRDAGREVEVTCEPTENLNGQLIRRMLRGEIPYCPETMAALFVADRLDHILSERYGMLRALEKGISVLSDRYYFSSFAYHGSEIPMKPVIRANSVASSILRPDLNIYLDITPETALVRLADSGKVLDIFESLNMKAQSDRRTKYFEAFEVLEEETVAIIDGEGDVEEVEQRVLQAVRERLQCELLA